MTDELNEAIDSQEEWEEIEEEIDAEEVERVVATLDQLIEQVESETVRALLQAACEEIADLVEWEDDEEQEGQAEAA